MGTGARHPRLVKLMALFGSGEPKIRAMKKADIPRVVAIINEHDEDDGAEALQSLSQHLEGMFVIEKGGFSLEQGGGIMGVIGAYRDPETDGVVWLSWTYVAEEHQRQGLGRRMFEYLVNELRNSSIRKMFISTSNFMEDGEDLYGPARAFYEAMGARHELQVRDYHARNEDMLVYGLDLFDDLQFEGERPPTGEFFFTGVQESDEVDDVYTLTWAERFPDQTDSEHEEKSVSELLDEAHRKRARLVLAVHPTDLSATARPLLQSEQFENIGELSDYYELGSSQVYWSRNMN